MYLMSFGNRVNITTQQIMDRVLSLEDTNLKLAHLLKLKIRQIDELETKVQNNTSISELQKTVNKINEDFSSIQNNTINNKTVDLLINSKMDIISKNVKGFSELIESKLINKITKLEELCNSKFQGLTSINSKIEVLEHTLQKVPFIEDVSTMSRQFSDRFDTITDKHKLLEDSVESRFNTIHKKFLDELPVAEDLKKLDEGLCHKFDAIEKFIARSISEITGELNNIKAFCTGLNKIPEPQPSETRINQITEDLQTDLHVEDKNSEPEQQIHEESIVENIKDINSEESPELLTQESKVESHEVVVEESKVESHEVRVESKVDSPEPVVEESKIESPEPVVEESKIESPEPVVEESKIESPEPVVEESKIESPEPVVEESKIESPKKTSKQVIEEDFEVEPIYETPKKKVSKPVAKPKKQKKTKRK